MTRISIGVRVVAAAAAVLAAASPTWVDAAARPGRGLVVERVVLLMRHGVRPPTKAQPMAAGIARDPWPTWPVPPGHLTPHGAEGVRRIAAWQRMDLSRRGLLRTGGCPAKGAIRIVADSDERTIRTGEAFAEAFAPGCGLATIHRPQGEADPLFSPLDPEVGAPIPPAAARQAVLDRLGPGGIQAKVAANAGLLNDLQRVLGCCSAAICQTYGAPEPCGFPDLKTTLVEGEGKPKMSGALDLGSTATQILLLEYVEGKPMDQVGWGRASKADIEALLALHPLEYDIVARPSYVARRGAAPLLAEMTSALQPGSPRLTVLVGHDTNIAHVGGALGLHWKAADYPANDPPPGGALGFELLRDAKGGRFIRAVFVAQSMDQLRTLARLDRTHPAARQVLAIPGCATAALCPLADFQRIVSRAGSDADRVVPQLAR